MPIRASWRKGACACRCGTGIACRSPTNCKGYPLKYQPKPGALAAALAFLLAPSLALCAPPESLDLQAYRGKVVYVDFWASWCGPCRESFPWMQTLESRYRDQGLVVLGVNLDHERSLADEFLTAYRPAFRVLFDPDAKLAEHFNVQGMPASFLIDRHGKVRFQHVGFHAGQAGVYEHEVQALLGESAQGQVQ